MQFGLLRIAAHGQNGTRTRISHFAPTCQSKQAGRQAIFATLQEPQSAPSAESIALADLELAEAWKALSTKEQEILSLWAFEGLEPKQLAVALEKSENACAISLSRAKAKLTQLLTSENN